MSLQLHVYRPFSMMLLGFQLNIIIKWAKFFGSKTFGKLNPNIPLKIVAPQNLNIIIDSFIIMKLSPWEFYSENDTLSFPSNLTERIVCVQLVNHLVKNGLYMKYSSQLIDSCILRKQH